MTDRISAGGAPQTRPGGYPEDLIRQRTIRSTEMEAPRPGHWRPCVTALRSVLGPAAQPVSPLNPQLPCQQLHVHGPIKRYVLLSGSIVQVNCIGHAPHVVTFERQLLLP